MASIEVKVPRLHQGQLLLLESKKRFNTVLCGRRWGKTVLIRELCLAILEHKRIGLFAPEFKDVSETWEGIEDIFRGINEKIKGFCSIDNQYKTIHLTYLGHSFESAPCIEFWSLANERKKDSSRGRKYHRVIYEETQKVESGLLEYHWAKVARPTLADYKGDAWFFGTPPNSRSHYFYKLACRGAHSLGPDDYDIVLDEENKPVKDYMLFRMDSYKNPHLDPVELDTIREELPDLVFEQEFMARCVEYAESAFCISLTKQEVQKRVFGQLEYKTGLETWLSFDFNKNPMAATLWQKRGEGKDIACVAEFGAKGMEGITIYDTIEQVKAYFKQYGRPELLYITGDATGNTTDPRMRRGLTFYQIILEELNLTPREALRITKSNPHHADSHGQVNTYLALHRSFKIDEVKCKRLRADCLTARATPERGIDKKAYDPHFLDTMRYFMHNALPRKLPIEWMIKKTGNESI